MMVDVIHESQYPDGGYSALVRHYGLEFAVHFIAGEVRVYGTHGRGNVGWRLASSAKAVKSWAVARVAGFGPEFMVLHNGLYAGESA